MFSDKDFLRVLEMSILFQVFQGPQYRHYFFFFNLRSIWRLNPGKKRQKINQTGSTLNINTQVHFLLGKVKLLWDPNL